MSKSYHSRQEVLDAEKVFGRLITESEYEKRLGQMQESVLPVNYYKCPVTNGKQWGAYKNPDLKCDEMVGMQLRTTHNGKTVFCNPDTWNGQKCRQDTETGRVRLPGESEHQLREALNTLLKISKKTLDKAQKSEMQKLEEDNKKFKEVKKNTVKHKMNLMFKEKLVKLLEMLEMESSEVYFLNQVDVEANNIMKKSEKAFSLTTTDSDTAIARCNNDDELHLVVPKDNSFIVTPLCVPKMIWNILKDKKISSKLRSKFREWWSDYFGALYAINKEEQEVDMYEQFVPEALQDKIYGDPVKLYEILATAKTFQETPNRKSLNRLRSVA